MNTIFLTNYRCYKSLDLSFKKKTNLLIGDNSSGKTTVIRAIRSVLSSFFSGYSDEYTRFSGLSKADFTVQNTDLGHANDEPITANFNLLGIEAQLKLNSIKSRTLQTPLEPIYIYGKNLKEKLFDETGNRVNPLPLFASFSTEDIHSSRKLSMTPFKKYSHKPSFGYYECLQGDGFFSYWTKRLLVLKEGGKGNIEISCVEQAIQKVLGVDGCNIINTMEIRANQGKVYYLFMDGREIDSENLSDGYTRLVNMVTDLAFRCALLNQGIYGEEACLKTEGTVLIDEIDLHLHPSLQSVVVKGLQNAFPKLQFIITSHAPMVMTSIPMDNENKIIKLEFNFEKGYTAKEIETYGLDASTLIQTVLGVIPRSKEVDDRLKTLFDLIDIDEYDKATAKLKEMRDEFGDHLPELAKAQAMLNFLGDEND